jgi:homogentisate 1,2-dioxygenase
VSSASPKLIAAKRRPGGEIVRHEDCCVVSPAYVLVLRRGPPASKIGLTAVTVVARREGRFTALEMPACPLDVVGWDGTVWPWAFHIRNFHPKTSLVHLPPTIHGTFAIGGGLACSFVPRLMDWHPDAIPCPYPHASVHCDEVIFYCEGNFTSRKGVGPGSLSWHPMGTSHGPHPGAYEGSIGHRETNEMAVMLDVFKPLRATPFAMSVEDPDDHRSFIP